MRAVLLAVMGAATLSAQGFGSFVEADVRDLSREQVPAPAEVKARLPLTLVALKGTNWSENRVLRHARRAAATFAACGIALDPVTLVRARTPDGRHDLEMTELHPRAGTPDEVFQIAGMLPRAARRPVVFFVGRLLGDGAIARSYGLGAVAPGSEPDFPYMNTAWVAYKAHWIERADEGYSSLAHELGHLLCACGHAADDQPHLLHTHRNMLSPRILPAHCEAMLSSPLLSLERSRDISASN